MYLNDLNHGFDRMTPTAQQKARMLDAVMEGRKKGATVKMKRKVRWKTALVAAAALFALTATTVFAVDLGWHEKFMEYFGIGEGQEALLDGAVDTPGLSVTENGVTFTVWQTITDSHGVYVFLDVTLPDDVTVPEVTDRSFLPSDLGFGTHRIQVDTAGDDIFDQGGWEFLSFEGNTFTVMLSSLRDEAISDGRISLHFEDIGYYDWDKVNAEMDAAELDENGHMPPIFLEMTIVIEGTWDLSWDYTYGDTSKIMLPDETVENAGVEGVIAKIAASPISISVDALLDSASSDRVALWIDQMVVTFRDGSELVCDASISDSSYSAMRQDTGEYYFYYRFDSLIDPDEIVSVTICDTVFPFD